MKARIGILGFLAGAFALANSQVHAGQMGELCTTLNAMRANEAVLNRQMANEGNPLKRDALAQQSEQIQLQRRDYINNFTVANHGQFSNLTGRVSSMVVKHFLQGPGVNLEITLPCDFVPIQFLFLEITKPIWGTFDPKLHSSLPKWRTALEDVAVGDSVTFSGRFVGYGEVGAVLTELRKQGGIAYKVPDELVLRENARREDDLRKQKIIEGIANQLSGNWSGEWEVGGLSNPLAVNKGAFGLDLKRNGSVLTGTYYERGGSSKIGGSIDGGQITFSCEYGDGSSRRFVGTIGVTGEVSGRWDQKNGSGTWKMVKKPSPDRPNVPTSAPLEGQASPVVQSGTTGVPPTNPVASQTAVLPQVAADTTQPQIVTQGATVAVTVDPAAQLAGLWVGNFGYGLLPFTVNLRAHSGHVDDVIGDTVYGVDKDVFCAGEVVLRESGDNAFVLEERITRPGLVCPGGGTIKMHIQTPSTAAIEWYRQKKPDKVAVRATVSRR